MSKKFKQFHPYTVIYEKPIPDMLSLIITFEFFYRALFPKYIIKPNNGNDHRTLVCTKKNWFRINTYLKYF